MLVRTSKDKDHPYVLLNKTFLEDPKLSLKSKGLLAYCMSKPDGWKFHVSQMEKVLKEKEVAILSAFKELIDNGYCVRYRTRNHKGLFDSQEYVLFEVPQNPDDLKKLVPHRGFTDLDVPDLVPQVLVSNEEQQVNNDSSNICADSVAAPKSKKNTKKEKPIIDRISRRELVNTSVEEHEDLVSKHGQDLIEKCYDALEIWKKSIREKDPKSVDRHTDFYRIKSWVVKKVKEGELYATREYKSNNRSGSNHSKGGDKPSVKQGIYIDGKLMP